MKLPALKTTLIVRGVISCAKYAEGYRAQQYYLVIAHQHFGILSTDSSQ